MPDTTPPAPPPPSQQDYDFQLAKMRIENSAVYVGRMIWLITLIAGLISIIVVLSVIIIAIVNIVFVSKGLGEIKIPDVLANWGGIILGFYFGQFVNLVKDYMGLVNNTGTPSDPRATRPSSPA